MWRSRPCVIDRRMWTWPSSQVGFFSFICMPFYTVVADLVDPDMLPLSRLKQKLRYWQTKKHARRWEAAAKLEGPLRRPA